MKISHSYENVFVMCCVIDDNLLYAGERINVVYQSIVSPRKCVKC